MRASSRSKLSNSMVSTIDREGRVFRESVGPTLYAQRPEDVGWAQSGTAMLGRDLPQTLHDKMIRLSFALYRQNPMAKRLINMEVSFILGGSIVIAGEDEKVLEVLNEWWNDPYNRWPQKIVQRLYDLCIYGEWVHIPVVSEESGRVWIRSIQPDTIRYVLPSAEAHDTPDQVVFKQAIDRDGTTRDDLPMPIIRQRLNMAKAELDKGPTGDIFLFGLNQTSDTMRGVGELFPLIDYIDIYDEMMFNRAEAVANRSSVWFDLKLEGMSQEQIEAYLKAETELPPRPGTLWAHNERAEMKAVTPNMQADDHAEDSRVIHSHIVSSAGWPGTFFDDPGSAGRAVGAEMAEPAYKNILMLQEQVRQMLRTEMDYVLFHAKRVGRLPENLDIKPDTYYLGFGRPSARDLQRTGPAMFRLAQALDMSWKGNLISREQAAQILVSQVNQLGLADMPFSVELGVDPRTKLYAADKAKMAQATAPAQGGDNVDGVGKDGTGKARSTGNAGKPTAGKTGRAVQPGDRRQAK